MTFIYNSKVWNQRNKTNMVFIEICTGISLFGSIILVIMGSLLIGDYEYIEINGIPRDEAGFTCLWAAGIYVMILGIMVYLIGRKEHAIRGQEEIQMRIFRPPDRDSSDEDEEAPFL
ncbi:unnamed protein product [Blepharisma stoltei]|uniref:Uncharacterized protein n=1 Tax=Blepharisma stoltei TaxID=1481888 RepID=A0AAU9IR16_9CILI|nr:unnamed protein product [Blepharisma stoltei]